VLETLARLDAGQVDFVDEAPGNSEESVHLIVAEGLEAFLPQSGLIDVAKELERLSKQRGELEKALQGYHRKLGTASFVEKAPAAVVQGVRSQATETEEKLRILRRRIEQLGIMATATTAK